MNVLITGGAGYLGSVLVERLLADEYVVTVVDNFQHRVPSLNHLCHNPNLTIVRGDARDGVFLQPHINKADAIIPLAAIVGAPACAYDQHSASSTNLMAVYEICERSSKEQMILYPNTNSGYGIGGEELCTEESPLQPISIYGGTKVEAERRVLRHPLGISFRFATLFGVSPRMRLDLMVNDFVYRAVRDKSLTLFEGHFRRNFLHVRDAANAFVWGLAGILKPQQVYNVGDTRANMTKNELCEHIQSHVAGFEWVSVKGADPDKRDYIVSNAKIEGCGWSPLYTLNEGIEELIRCYQQPFESWRNV